MYDDLYCKVFVDADINYDEMFSRVIHYLGGERKSFSYIDTDWCDISVRQNKGYNKEQYLHDMDDFLYWKFYFDVEPREVDEITYIKRIRDLLKYFREFCNAAVAACDFEDELMD